MNTSKMHGALPALLVAVVGWGGIVGCSETAIQGSVLDHDVANSPLLQIALARGSNSEVTDIMTVGTGYKYWVLGMTDDIMNAGSAGSEQQAAMGDMRHRDSNSHWEQGMEGAWAGLKVVNNAMIAFTPEEFNITPIVARGYLNSAPRREAPPSSNWATIHPTPAWPSRRRRLTGAWRSWRSWR